MLGRVKEFVRDLLFPVFCVDCGREGFWFCKQCKRRMKIRPFIFYPPIEEINCGALAFFPYVADSVIGKLIHYWKYNYVEEIAEQWQQFISDEHLFLTRFLAGFNKNESIYLVPVPLHHRRERERGFNQAAVLADIIKNNLINLGYNVDVLNCLNRVRYTSQQAKLDPIGRQKNLAGAFVFKQKNIVPNQVILVDDVFTTGFTAKECAKVLRAAGVKNIGNIVLARG